eukprot:scaffold2962_cov126-Cylindrotheca_fusiformis.AAC.17
MDNIRKQERNFHDRSILQVSPTMNGPDKDTAAATKPEASPTELPEASPDSNEDSPKEKKAAKLLNYQAFVNRKQTWIVRGVICVLLVACAVLLVLYFTKETEDNSPTDPPTDGDSLQSTPTETPTSTENTTPPTNNPFQDDSKLARLYSILEPVAPSGFYEYDTAEEPTPEYQAWAWLSQKDMSLDTNREYTPHWKIVERYALAVFYYATNGDSWVGQYGFLTNDPVCEWKRDNGNGFDNGIRFCSDGSVTMLHMPGNNIEGRIPTYIGLLSNLTSLDLPANLFIGSMPNELSKLTNLKDRLDFSNNRLTGTVTSSLGQLKDLKYLSLKSNRLVGALPTEIALMTSLTSIHLSLNQLSGEIPTAIDSLSHLRELRLDDNRLSENAACSANCVSDMSCSCCFQCYAREVDACSKVSPVEQGCRIIMDDDLNMKSSMIEAKNGDTGGWTYNKDFAFQVTDRLDTDRPWTVRGWIDIEDQPIWYMPRIGVPDVNCSTMMTTDRYVMRDDSQLRFIELPDYPCTEFGKRIIYFLIMEWFYFG